MSDITSPTTATEIPEETIFDIPEHRFGDLEKKVERFARKSAKLGTKALITIENLGEKFVEIMKRDYQTGKQIGTGQFNCFIQVKVHGEAPVVNGHTFVARIEHTEAGNIISKAPGAEDIAVPNEVRDGGSFCDHCDTQRNRNDTFLLRVDATNELKRVGRNCLADFVRDADAAGALSMWTLLRDIEAASESDEDGSWGGGGSHYFLTADYVAHCFRSVELNGWQSRGGSYDGGPQPTADGALFGINPCPSYPGAKEDWDNAQPTEANKAEAAEAMEWAKGLSGENDYEHNLKVSCSLGCVKPKNMGIVASLTIAYRRFCEREIERAQREKKAAVSEYFGNVDSRYLKTLKVMKTKDMDSEWGLTVLYTMEDENGLPFKWFASGGCRVLEEEDGYPTRSLKAGDCFPFLFTIKKHSEFKGMKETTITRAQIQTADSKPPKWVGKDGEVFKTKKAMTAAA